jgi:hypothetical protein
MKVSKSEARYREYPSDGHQCAGCSMYRIPYLCITVEGEINPQGWCKFWARRGADMARQVKKK